MRIKELLKQKHNEYMEELKKKLYPLKFTTKFSNKMFAYVSKSSQYNIEVVTEQDEDGNIESWTR